MGVVVGFRCDVISCVRGGAAEANCSGGVQRVWVESINQSCIFRVVQVIKLLQDPLEVGNNLLGINDNVRERGLEQKCF